MSPKTTPHSWMRLRAIPPFPSLIWVVGPAETCATSDHWATTSWAWTDRRNSWPWRAPIRSARFSNRISSRWKLPESRFDGIFANASLFHVPSQELPRVLAELSETLRSRGVLFCSNPRGNNQEGLSGDRYSCFFDYNTWRNYVTAAGLVHVRHYYRPPGLPRHKQ